MKNLKKPHNFFCDVSAGALDTKNSISASGELLLYGVIGEWWDGLDALSIVTQLNAMPGSEIVVRIQSPGGSVAEGLAMFNNLKQSSKKVIVYIDGIAASMASAIAMAGDEIIIPSNALFMLHKPSAMVGGNANQLRDYADDLDVYEGSLLQIYSDRTGKTMDEIRALLADGKDHYFRGQDAIDYGLADKLAGDYSIQASAKHIAALGVPAAYASTLFKPTAAAAASTTEENTMKIKIKAKGGGWHFVPAITAALENSYKTPAEIIAALAKKGIQVTEAALNGESEVDEQTLGAIASALEIPPVQNATPSAQTNGQPLDAEAAIAQERQRVKELRELGVQASVDVAIINAWIDSGMTVPEARVKALEAMAQRDKDGSPSFTHVRVGSGVTAEALRGALVGALLHRAMPGTFKLDQVSAEFRTFTVMDMIKQVMAYAGESVSGKTVSDLIAMAMHTTSDFPLILQESANKVLRNAYALAPNTYQQIAVKTTSKDFRAKHSLQIGGGSGLEKVGENGEFKAGSLSESDDSYKLDTYGKLFPFTRQLMINDDVGALVRFFNTVGLLAGRNENKIVWNLVKSNPNLRDGIPVYSTNTKRKNLVTGAAIDEATATKLKKSHRQMVGLDGEPLNIAPKFLVVNSEREVEAAKFLEIVNPSKTSDVNIFARTMDLIVETQLDGVANNPFWTFADPALVPAIEYAYLEGEEGPVIEADWGFEVDGMTLKIRHDFGAGFVDYRGTAQSTGAA
ncbi:head maturation protease, ClpP-related [Cellvibrio mixtus]|uniref:head maturation protease, ClpP-related n=1 Tax=Cellvibrio mixtus TaxID=39650 RepID=UPI0005868798|nr:head maturation protease, ClpP-related [Cellvibrio mixtus]